VLSATSRTASTAEATVRRRSIAWESAIGRADMLVFVYQWLLAATVSTSDCSSIDECERVFLAPIL
jgi:hypothetical protein